jgi:hypothetical protein
MPAGYSALLVSAQSDGSALSNTTTATIINPASARFTLPANFLSAPGQKLKLRAGGRISIAASAALTLAIKVGSGVGNSIAASPSMTLNGTTKTNVAWWLDWDLTLRAIGASGNFMHIGSFVSEAVISSAANTANCAMIPPSSPAVGSNIDTTAANTIDLVATWGAASASNSIQVHQYELWSDN